MRILCDYKEMVYVPHNERIILCKGTIKDHNYYIMSMGTHPCAYVELSDKDTRKNYDNIDVHGGITYNEDYLNVEDGKTLEGRYIGWDYCHSGDYYEYEEINLSKFVKKNKKWKVKQIREHVIDVINQLVEMETENVNNKS